MACRALLYRTPTAENECDRLLASVGQHAQTVQLVIELVPPDVRLQALSNLGMGDRPPGFSFADSEDLLGPDAGQLRRRLLAAVDAKRSQETREADEPRTCIAEAQHEVPVHREAKRL